MAAGGGDEAKAGTAGCGGGDDLYAVLGLKKECSAADLRSAYRKLALRWHPDRCCAAGSSKATEDAKTKFQAIQEAYSVLSDTNKRFLYDVGVYDSDDGGYANGMGEFLGELAAMMSQAKSHEGGNETETFEQLQQLFVEMFQADAGAGAGGGGTATASSRAQRGTNGCDRPFTSNTCFVTTSYSFCYGNGGGSHKRDCDEMQAGKAEAACDGAAGLGPGSSFCFGVGSVPRPLGRVSCSCSDSFCLPSAKCRRTRGGRRGHEPVAAAAAAVASGGTGRRRRRPPGTATRLRTAGHRRSNFINAAPLRNERWRRRGVEETVFGRIFLNFMSANVVLKY